MSLASFYRDKTVLVTGHTGFKGGWLIEWLKLLGAKPIGLSLPPESTPNLFEAANIMENMVSIMGDVKSMTSVADTFNTYSPDVVFHMAAQSLVRRSYIQPVETYATNIMGTVHILEAARQAPSVRAVVIITSDKCYENREWVWGYREDDVLGGHDPYSSSKACAELVTSSYRSAFAHNNQIGIASARAGNVVGGGDWAEDRLIPDIVRALSTNKPILIRNPNAIRPWQHVLEPLRGYLMLGERLYESGADFTEAWNFGPDDEEAIAVRELVERSIGRWGSGELVIEATTDGLHEANYLKLDCSKAKSKLGWKPLLGVDEALDMTIEWYKAYLDNPEGAGSLVTKQIEAYMERVLE